ncbi:DUF805 domain-containing protein [Sulfurimonas sp.]|uniref:DUF805 domain-containing protein n=1 Tax=Sulfurimonas sp. TaxID=2022749 RepID=UPI003D0E339D
MEYFTNVYQNKYADFTGRARRKEYWMFYLYYALVIFALAFMAGFFSEINQLISNIFAGVIVLFILGSMIPFWAITARRLHDINMSGWWQLLYLIPYLGGLIVFIFMLLPGNQGSNRFGDDPLIDTPTTNTIVPPDDEE